MSDLSEPGQPESAAEARPAAFPIVPDHELIRLIGGGSGGQVWLARNALETYRAVKVVYERTFRHRRPFEQEFNGVVRFEPVSRLHDGLVDILQVGYNEAGGYFYCVMELGDDVNSGQVVTPEHYQPRTLNYDIALHKRLPVAECIRLGAAIASALSFLHRHGLIHRDIKPSNIIFVNGFPKLADVGLVADLSEAGAYVGTEGFIAPEGPGTVQADIYSLGKVLYEISTGKDRNEYPELPADLGDSPEDRDLVKFNKSVLKACRVDPQRRYNSADDLMRDLLAFQFCQEDAARERRVQRWITVIGVAGAVVALGVIIGLLWRLLWLLEH